MNKKKTNSPEMSSMIFTGMKYEQFLDTRHLMTFNETRSYDPNLLFSPTNSPNPKYAAFIIIQNKQEDPNTCLLILI